MEFSINVVIFGLIGILALIAGVSFVIYRMLHSRSNSGLTEKYADADRVTLIKTRSKYPEVNIFRSSGPLFRLGLVFSLAAIVLAFNATSYEKDVYIPDDALEFDEEIEIEPPRTKEPPPPPPPPPPPIIEEVPEEEILEDEEPEFLDQSIEEETVVEEVEVEEALPPPPPPLEPEVDEIFTIVEENPRFPGCENKGTKAEKETCSRDKLLQYLYKNLKYPAIAKENGVEGTVVIQFVVEKDGFVTDARIARDIGAGCGEEALRVVNMMKGWTPGKQRGRAVRVQFTLPVKFKLE